LEIVKYLIFKGADIHAENDYSLIIASTIGSLAIVKCLIHRGANIHAENDAALRNASEGGYLEVVKYLMLSGANVNSCKEYSNFINDYCVAEKSIIV